MTTCLYVIGIVGVFCFAGADPVGNCYDDMDYHYCTIEADELPIRASWYNPSLGGVNCMEPCAMLGDGTPVNDGYGTMAACPMGWYGNYLHVDGLPTVQCRDHGGAIHPTWYEELGQWAIVIDYLLPDAEWFIYGMYQDWRIE